MTFEAVNYKTKSLKSQRPHRKKSKIKTQQEENQNLWTTDCNIVKWYFFLSAEPVGMWAGHQSDSPQQLYTNKKGTALQVCARGTALLPLWRRGNRQKYGGRCVGWCSEGPVVCQVNVLLSRSDNKVSMPILACCLLLWSSLRSNGTRLNAKW